MKSEIQVVSIETGEVVHRVDTTGSAGCCIETIMRGLLINLDSDRFFLRDTRDDDQGDTQ
jgi:hypothetical protein